MPVSSRLQQLKVKLLHNFMQNKITGRFKKSWGGGKQGEGPLCSRALHKKSGILPDFLFEDP